VLFSELSKINEGHLPKVNPKKIDPFEQPMKPKRKVTASEASPAAVQATKETENKVPESVYFKSANVFYVIMLVVFCRFLNTRVQES